MERPPEQRARSFEHALELLFEDSWQEPLRRHRSNLAFRGLSDARRGLRSSLTRLGGPFPEIEYHLLRNFRKYAHEFHSELAEPPSLDARAPRGGPGGGEP